MRAVAATNPDLVVICSYPPDSVGMVKAVNEIGFKPKMIGGGMVGLQATALKVQLGPMLKGFVNYDWWLPVPKMQFSGVEDLIKRYQARAAAEGVDALGSYMAPSGYAQLQVLQQAITATKSIEDKKLADYIHPCQRRMGAIAGAANPVPRRQGQRRRAVPHHEHPDRADARRLQVRQRDLP